MARLNVAINQEAAPLLLEPISFATSGDNTITTPLPGSIIEVYRLFLEIGGATVLTFKSGNTALSGPLPMQAHSFIDLDFDTKPWFQTSGTDSFIINSSNAVQVSGQLAFIGGTVTATDLELREDNSVELREDVSFEIRDGP